MESQTPCVYGVRGCIHAAVEHDEDCCFNGVWTHEYVCQDCGHVMPSSAYKTKQRADGTYVSPEFKPVNCRKCGGKRSMV